MELEKRCGQKHMGELSELLVYVWFTRWTFMPTPERQRGRERRGTLKGHAQEFFFLSNQA